MLLYAQCAGHRWLLNFWIGVRARVYIAEDDEINLYKIVVFVLSPHCYTLRLDAEINTNEYAAHAQKFYTSE